MAHPVLLHDAGISDIIAFGRFDLDDLGAEAGQDQRRQRAEDDTAQIEDADARQRAGTGHFKTPLPPGW